MTTPEVKVDTTAAPAAPATSAAAPAASDDGFDAAFAEAIAAVEAPAPTEASAAAAMVATDDAAAKKVVADDAAKKLADEAAAKKAADDAAAAATAAAAAPAAPAAAAPVAPAAAAPAPTAEEVAAKKLADEAAAKKAADDAAAKKISDEAAAKKAADDAAAREAAAKAAEIKDPVLSEDSKKTLDNFTKEWPDIAAAVNEKVAHEVALIEAKFARAFASFAGQVFEHLEPIANSVSTADARTFREQVLSKHADYDTISPALLPWIEKQPAYLTAAYKRVYDEGTAQELTDLVSRFKTETGKSQSPAATTQQPAAPAAPAAPSAAVAAKAAELAPTSAKRTTPTPTGVDMENFDDAFEEAAAALDTSPPKK